MATFSSKLKRSEEIAKGTKAFYFERPEGFSFLGGQHATLEIKDSEGQEWEHTFSFITSPTDDEVGFATRISDSEFKQNLVKLQKGDSAEINDPRGSMTLPNNTSRPLVMLAGGIGITPFMGIIHEAGVKKSEQEMCLFYSNRTRSEAPFLDELRELDEKNSNFTFVPTLTKEEWDGETGYIDAEMIKKYISDISSVIYYLAGPSGFVKGMMKTLEDMGVESVFIKSEDYGAYGAEPNSS